MITASIFIRKDTIEILSSMPVAAGGTHDDHTTPAGRWPLRQSFPDRLIDILGPGIPAVRDHHNIGQNGTAPKSLSANAQP